MCFVTLASRGYFAGAVIAIACSVAVALCSDSGVQADCTGQCHEVEALVTKTTAGAILYTNTFKDNLQGTKTLAQGPAQGTYDTADDEIDYDHCPDGANVCP